MSELEILTVTEVAQLLKMSRRQVYEQTRQRARAGQPMPIPVLRINGNLSDFKSDIVTWLNSNADRASLGKSG